MLNNNRIYKLKALVIFMRIYVPLMRRLIDYFQEKQANYELGNAFVDMVGKESKRVSQDIQNHNEKNQIENLAFLATLGGAYQKNPQLFVRPKKPSRLQRIMFSVSNQLDKVVA